jgi:hypothetical protein
MDMAGIIALIQVVIATLPGAIKTAQEIYDLGARFFATVNGREPTAAEIAGLRAMIDVDVIKALEPLPPAQPGDPDYVPPAA